jgi:ABC-type ATPase with predicted acetyltransferase domain
MKYQFNITKSSNLPDTFKTCYIKSKFDIQCNQIIEHFEGELNLPDQWNIGVIVGSSGTGKTTIANDIFGITTKKEYDNLPIIESINSNKTIDEIVDVFNKVGFSSPPSWLKPYNVLSNGEKMRVDIASAILSQNDIIVFDEFTSVVDRTVATIGSYAIAKYIRKQNKKFVAVSCHNDILNWLEPDWIFDTNQMRFFQQGTVNTLNINDQISTLKYENATETIGDILVNIII